MTNTITLGLTIIRDQPNDNAVLVCQDDRRDKVWLPRSQIEIEYETETAALVTMPEWLGIEKDLI